MTTDAFSAPFEVTVTHVGTATVISVTGDVDFTTAPHLIESVDAVLTEARPTSLVIDLTDVPSLASVGISVLIEAASRIPDSATFALVADGPNTARPLTLVGMRAARSSRAPHTPRTAGDRLSVPHNPASGTVASRSTRQPAETDIMATNSGVMQSNLHRRNEFQKKASCPASTK